MTLDQCDEETQYNQPKNTDKGNDKGRWKEWTKIKGIKSCQNGHTIMLNVKKAPHSNSPGAGPSKKCRSFKYPPPTPWHWHCYCTLQTIVRTCHCQKLKNAFLLFVPLPSFLLLCAPRQNILFNYSSHCLSALILNDVLVSGLCFVTKSAGSHQTHPFTRFHSVTICE